MGAQTLEELYTNFLAGLAEMNYAELERLYLPSAWLTLVSGEDRQLRTVSEGIQDQQLLGVPVRLQITSTEVSAGQGRVSFEWDVEGHTPDGTDIELAGSGELSCSEQHGRWFIAEDRRLCRV